MKPLRVYTSLTFSGVILIYDRTKGDLMNEYSTAINRSISDFGRVFQENFKTESSLKSFLQGVGVVGGSAIGVSLLLNNVDIIQQISNVNDPVAKGVLGFTAISGLLGSSLVGTMAGYTAGALTETVVSVNVGFFKRMIDSLKDFFGLDTSKTEAVSDLTRIRSLVDKIPNNNMIVKALDSDEFQLLSPEEYSIIRQNCKNLLETKAVNASPSESETFQIVFSKINYGKVSNMYRNGEELAFSNARKEITELESDNSAGKLLHNRQQF